MEFLLQNFPHFIGFFFSLFCLIKPKNCKKNIYFIFPKTSDFMKIEKKNQIFVQNISCKQKLRIAKKKVENFGF